MQYPSFYDDIPSIRLYDPLSDFLGALDDGKVEITYLDCVKLAGHSCPTVAGVYLMAMVGLKALYGDELPNRGDVKVSMREDETQGVTGVVANVIAFIVGAGGRGGFKGIQNKFSRNNLIDYNGSIQGELTLTRTDTNASVTLSYDPSSIPADARLMPLMGKRLQGSASLEEEVLFKQLWQERVKTILFTADYHTLITIH